MKIFLSNDFHKVLKLYKSLRVFFSKCKNKSIIFNTMPFINIHTHQLQKFDKNNIVVLNQTIRSDFSNTVSDAEKYFTYRTFGLHPWYLDKKTYEVELEKLETLLQENKIIAIGECGLDKLRGPDLDFQISVFEMQLHLAKKYNRPVIIHCVRAFNELIATVKNVGADLRVCPRSDGADTEHLRAGTDTDIVGADLCVCPRSDGADTEYLRAGADTEHLRAGADTKVCPYVVHGFNNNKNILKQLINAGFYISLGAAILKDDEKNAHDWREKINIMPLEKLFFETDDSGENIEVIYNRAAIFLDISLEALKTQIKKNFERVFS